MYSHVVNKNIFIYPGLRLSEHAGNKNIMPISRRCSNNRHPLYLQTYASSVTRTVIRFPCTVDIGYSDVLDIARILISLRQYFKKSISLFWFRISLNPGKKKHHLLLKRVRITRSQLIRLCSHNRHKYQGIL